MSGAVALTLVWLGASAPEGRPSGDVLKAWEETQGVLLRPPSREAADVEALAAHGERCDELLAQARNLMTEGDEGLARQRLAAAEQLLREQAFLPQAGWLMAERWRLEAQLETRAGRTERAALLDRRADVLEGPRAAAFGQSARQEAPGDEVAYTLRIRGAGRHQAYWDGVRAADEGRAARGEHHLAIARGGRTRWSGWVTLSQNGPIDVFVPDVTACSREDLEDVRLEPDRAIVPPGVTCPAWAIAGEGARLDSIRIARCKGDRCDPVREWASGRALAAGTPEPAERRAGIPPWAVWTLAGVGVAATTTVVLWGLGVFDRPAPRNVVTYDPGHL
jgi:hypothetical protein